MALTSSATTPPKDMALEAFLKIFLIIFEAAVSAMPVYPVSRTFQATASDSLIMKNKLDKAGFPVWIVHRDFSMAPMKNNPLPEADQSHWANLKYQNLCDSFCQLLLQPLAEKLQELFNAEVRWLRIMPRSSLQFVEDRKYIDNAKHSVLEITTTDGTVWIFDGTGLQFGWKRENWLLSKAEFSTLHKKGDWEEYPDKHIVREGVVGKYWAISDQLVKKLVPEFNWKTMSEIGSEELEQYVKDLADAKFNGAFELAKKTSAQQVSEANF